MSHIASSTYDRVCGHTAYSTCCPGMLISQSTGRGYLHNVSAVPQRHLVDVCPRYTPRGLSDPSGWDE